MRPSDYQAFFQPLLQWHYGCLNPAIPGNDKNGDRGPLYQFFTNVTALHDQNYKTPNFLKEVLEKLFKSPDSNLTTLKEQLLFLLPIFEKTNTRVTAILKDGTIAQDADIKVNYAKVMLEKTSIQVKVEFSNSPLLNDQKFWQKTENEIKNYLRILQEFFIAMITVLKSQSSLFRRSKTLQGDPLDQQVKMLNTKMDEFIESQVTTNSISILRNPSLLNSSEKRSQVLDRTSSWGLADVALPVDPIPAPRRTGSFRSTTSSSSSRSVGNSIDSNAPIVFARNRSNSRSSTDSDIQKKHSWLYWIKSAWNSLSAWKRFGLAFVGLSSLALIGLGIFFPPVVHLSLFTVKTLGEVTLGYLFEGAGSAALLAAAGYMHSRASSEKAKHESFSDLKNDLTAESQDSGANSNPGNSGQDPYSHIIPHGKFYRTFPSGSGHILPAGSGLPTVAESAAETPIEARQIADTTPQSDVANDVSFFHPVGSPPRAIMTDPEMLADGEADFAAGLKT